jgi:ATP-dependent HslUV protease subunit HslV
MSIVVAVKKGKDIVVAADGLTVFGSVKPAPGNVAVSKIRRVGRALVASTGWCLYENIMNDYLAGRKSVRLEDEGDVFRFFMGFWRALRKKYSYVNDQCEEKDSPFADLDSQFLVATRKRILYVPTDMSVTEFRKFHAIGSGADFAVGAMHVLYDQARTAREIASRSVEAAIAHSIYCGGEVEVVTP